MGLLLRLIFAIFIIFAGAAIFLFTASVLMSGNENITQTTPRESIGGNSNSNAMPKCIGSDAGCYSLNSHCVPCHWGYACYGTNSGYACLQSAPDSNCPSRQEFMAYDCNIEGKCTEKATACPAKTTCKNGKCIFGECENDLDCENPEKNSCLNKKCIEYVSDYSQKVVVDYNTFPSDYLIQIKNKAEFAHNLNTAYNEYVEITGSSSAFISAEKPNILFIADKVPAEWCMLSGNPIRISPTCLTPLAQLNIGDPGWGPLHELGHDFIHTNEWKNLDNMGGPLSWAELWANMLTYYYYDQRPTLHLDNNFWKNRAIAGCMDVHSNIMNQVKSQCPSGIWAHDALMSMFLELKDKYGWMLWQKLFNKEHDNLQNLNDSEKRIFFASALAESAKEITGQQKDYEYVATALADWGFPKTKVANLPT